MVVLSSEAEINVVRGYWVLSGVSLKELSRGFADGLDMRGEIPRGGKDDCKMFGLNDWKEGIIFNRYWEAERGAGWEENQEFDS